MKRQIRQGTFETNSSSVHNMTILNEKEYELTDFALGICDDEGLQCLGGIMGGLEKGC